MKTHITLAVRVDDSNPLHHLWNNHGTWWCHFTLHSSDGTAERKRFSLKTGNVQRARRRRDAIFAALHIQAESPRQPASELICQ